MHFKPIETMFLKNFFRDTNYGQWVEGGGNMLKCFTVLSEKQRP